MGLLPWEKTITCPYNPAHQITMERIQTHLVKCRRNHPKEEYAICPYNASHHIPRPEEQFHTTICPDRKVVELAKYTWAMEKPARRGDLDGSSVCSSAASDAGGNESSSGMSKMEIQKIMTKDENWENEAYIKESYNPAKKAASTPVIRYVQGATPSERKKFYASEKQRHELLKQKAEEKRRELESASSTISVPESENFFLTPRPSINISRPPSAIFKLDTLRRPTLGGLSDRDRGESFTGPQRGSVTSELLAMAETRERTSNRKGSILMNNDTISINDSASDLDTSRDSSTSTSTTLDPVEEKFNQLMLARRPSAYQPLRRPSGLGSFIKKQ